MKTIELFRFTELTRKAKINALCQCVEHTADVVDNYINEIYTDHTRELKNVFYINLTSSVDDNVVTTRIFMSSDLKNMTDQAKIDALFKVWSDRVADGQVYFTDEVKKAIANYSGETPSTFLRRFFASLDYEVTDWAVRTKNSPEYVLTCIGDQSICICNSDDLIPENYFDIDGNIIRIGC